MYMLVLQSLSTNLELCPAVNIPKDPSMIIAYPTVGLEEEMVRVIDTT